MATPFKKVWVKIATAVGFTRQEQLIVLFLSLGLLLGSAVSFIRKHNSEGQNFQYIELEKQLAARAAVKRRAQPHSAVLKININTASQKELERLPHIGAVLAQNIIAYRQRYGEFKSIEELKQVKGVGEKIFAKLKPYICTQ